MFHNNQLLERQEQLEKEKREKEEFRYDLKVNFILKDTEFINDFAAFHLVKKFCSENNIVFSAREYNSYAYKEDRDYVEKLPAFHLFTRKNSDYISTFYANDNPIQKIQSEIVKIKEENEKKLRKKELWDKKVANLISFFEHICFKKPVLKEKIVTKKKSIEKVPIEYNNNNK